MCYHCATLRLYIIGVFDNYFLKIYFGKTIIDDSVAGNVQGFVCLFVCFCGRPLSKELGIPIGILPTSGAGVDGNAPYQVDPGIQTNSLPPRPVQS